jgi:hypothetical protein
VKDSEEKRLTQFAQVRKDSEKNGRTHRDIGQALMLLAGEACQQTEEAGQQPVDAEK